MSGRITLNLDRGTDFRLDVSFEIPDKGITVLFGPSGCGKTTVLRCTAGLERAAGRVVVADRVWQDDARNIFVPAWERRLGYVFQEASLFEHLNVEGNLRFGLRHKDARGGLARFSEAVELLGIGHLLQRRVQLLSGGERQRVAIARALLMTPDLILMDEPLAALDWNRKQEILPWLERLRDELSVPMLYVTHSADEMARLADQVICFENGRIVAEGPLEEVLLERWPGQGEQGASVVLSGVVTERSEKWRTAVVTAGETAFEVPDAGRNVDSCARRERGAQRTEGHLDPQRAARRRHRDAGRRGREPRHAHARGGRLPHSLANHPSLGGRTRHRRRHAPLRAGEGCGHHRVARRAPRGALLSPKERPLYAIP